MVSRLGSGFRHLRHEPDLNAKRCAGGLFRLRQPNSCEAISELLESRGLESATSWIDALAAHDSVLAPRVPAGIFESEAAQGLSECVPERHFPTDWSFERE